MSDHIDPVSLAFDLEDILLAEGGGEWPPPAFVAAVPVEDLSTLGNDTFPGLDVAAFPLEEDPLEGETPNATPTPRKSNVRPDQSYQELHSWSDEIDIEEEAGSQPSARGVYFFAVLCAPALIGIIFGLSWGLARIREQELNPQRSIVLDTPAPFPPDLEAPSLVPSSQPSTAPENIVPTSPQPPQHTTAQPSSLAVDTNSPTEIDIGATQAPTEEEAATPLPTMSPTKAPTPKKPASPVKPTSHPVAPTLAPARPTHPPTRPRPQSPTQKPQAPTSKPQAPTPRPTPRLPLPTPYPVPITPWPVSFMGDTPAPAATTEQPSSPESPYRAIFPKHRYTAWIDTDGNTRNLARVLGYNKYTWNKPWQNDIELKSFSTISSLRKRTALAQLGFHEETWDCWVNHYDDYHWVELEEEGLSWAFEALGWTPNTWVNPDPSSWPLTWTSPWVDLSSGERAAAEALCYTLELWNLVPIPRWDTIERAKDDFLTMLESRSLESLLTVLEDVDSAQHRAFAWITSERNYFDYSMDRRIQRWVLAVLALGLTDNPTGGAKKASILESWVQSSNECTWYTGAEDSPCDQNGLYVRINLRDSNLYGALPHELSLLSNSLKWIVLHGNNLYGSIPESYGDLGLLERLILTGNQLDGAIPSELGQLSRLTVLELAANNLVLQIPTELGNLQRIDTLRLDKNGLTGPLPTELRKLTKMSRMRVEQNHLTGLVPAYDSLASLESLNLSHNDFVGSIPENFCSLPALEFLSADCDKVSCPCCRPCNHN